MPDGVDIKVRNLDLHLRRLKRVVPEVEAELDAALAKTADEYVSLAKDLVPDRSGTLRDSIHASRVDGFARFENKKTMGGRSAKSIRKFGQRRSVTQIRFVSAEISYGVYAAAHWIFQEFGTVQQAARPVFFPLYRLLRKRAVGRARRALGKAVKRALAR